MRLFFLLCCGALVGWSVHYYLTHFRNHLAKQVWQAYEVLLQPPQISPQPLPDCQLPALKCGHFFWFSLAFSIVGGIAEMLAWEMEQALVLLGYVALGYVIVRLDFAYQLIPPALCQGVFLLGIARAWLGLGDLDLAQSLQSALLGFAVFYGVHFLTHWYYGREALGQGDCWLMLGLGSFVPWQQLPLLVLMACLLALVYVAYEKIRGNHLTQIPFGPFLFGACSILLLINPSWLSMIFPSI